jgi:hypothetical protein
VRLSKEDSTIYMPMLLSISKEKGGFTVKLGLGEEKLSFST